ncbi:hypothetical protein [Marinifilum caeruleilacunae]|uniref:hypothetical protein n=1 Tax=Marinifilum caeruleilacunae TaxID=2499076 RepID=UPI001492AAD7|nr:hypothetical protein [Marinifilum caeruleilacunae]
MEAFEFFIKYFSGGVFLDSLFRYLFVLIVPKDKFELIMEKDPHFLSTKSSLKKKKKKK